MKQLIFTIALSLGALCLNAQNKTIHFNKVFMGSKGMETSTLIKHATPYKSILTFYGDDKIKVTLPKINQTYIFNIIKVVDKNLSKAYLMDWRGEKYNGFLKMDNGIPVYFVYSNSSTKVLLKH